MSDDRRLVVVTAGLGTPSSTRLLADRLAAATTAELGARGLPVTVRVVELREHAHDITNTLLTGFAPAGLRAELDALAAADGVIVVSPIFNASYSGLFKSFVDVLPDSSLVDKPVLLAATGGTARHSLALEHALRPLFSYLRAQTVPTAVFAATDDWAGPEAERLGQRITRAGRELAGQVARYQPAPPLDPFRLTTTFDDLLPRQ